jgi:hypothetical protein
MGLNEESGEKLLEKKQNYLVGEVYSPTFASRLKKATVLRNIANDFD